LRIMKKRIQGQVFSRCKEKWDEFN
jgi:hypothetical protein